MKRRTLLGASLGVAATAPFASLTGWAKTSNGWGPSTDASAYVADNFGPVAKEITATDLTVVGKIPAELNGRYLRNGPNPLGDVDLGGHHWFIGEGMVHGVALGEGKALWYRNRYVRAPHIVERLGESLDGRALVNSNNTHVIGMAGRTLAIVESGAPPIEMSYELDTVGVNNFFGTWPAMGFSAHPKIDPDSGELHAMCYNWQAWRDHLKYVRVGKDGKVQHSVDIPVTGMPMIHDMSLTKNYAVIFDLPVTLNPALAQAGQSFPFSWNPDHEARVGLLPRNGTASDVVWCPVNPAYVFHPMNAYEDAQGNVVIDVCRYSAMFNVDQHGPFGDSLPTLARWTLNPTTRRVHEDQVHTGYHEFPRVSPVLNSKPHRYGYTVGVQNNLFPTIHKTDYKTGSTQTFDLGPGRSTGEAYFVPRQGASAEDDGYLLSYVYDANTRASVLQILDAQDFKRPPIAKVLLPGRVPYGFHGSWIADEAQGPSV